MTNFDWDKALLALTLWREARGEIVDAKKAVGCCIRNRVRNPRWWGTDYSSVMTKRWQFSSLTAAGDPNLIQWPNPIDTAWQACMQIADDVYNDVLVDTTNGATSYYDKSLDGNPPTWATDGSLAHKCDIGNFHFFG